MRRTNVSVEQILSWADAFRERTGQWPSRRSGHVWEPPDEKWANIDRSLRVGQRGLHRGQSLAKLLAKHRGKRNYKQLPKFSYRQILNWADAHHARLGRWPRKSDGPIVEAPGETWNAVNMALRDGQRGLPGGSTLALLLSKARNVPRKQPRPRLGVRQILRWADRHYRQTGNWPTRSSGPIPRSACDTWLAVDKALRNSRRGLRRSSLPKLLSHSRNVDRHQRRPPLTISLVLEWCDAHYARTDRWPRFTSGKIVAGGSETWQRVHNALLKGKRGLPGGKTLAKLLAERRKVRNRVGLRPLSEALIQRWARAHKRRYGHWPNRYSGLIPDTRGETWGGVTMALRRGGRGLQRRSTLLRVIHSQY